MSDQEVQDKIKNEINVIVRCRDTYNGSPFNKNGRHEKVVKIDPVRDLAKVTDGRIPKDWFKVLVISARGDHKRNTHDGEE